LTLLQLDSHLLTPSSFASYLFSLLLLPSSIFAFIAVSRVQNLIAQAQSGTGKTAAFTLGMLSRVDTSKKVAQAICVSPTRELARQIASNVHLMGKFLTGLEIAIAVPGDNRFEKCS
jgi:superfamily II DNA/RNA helicase